jgi:hypothetical protein
MVELNDLFYIDQDGTLRWKVQRGRVKPHSAAGKIYNTAAGKDFKPGDHLVKLNGCFYLVDDVKEYLKIELEISSTHSHEVRSEAGVPPAPSPENSYDSCPSPAIPDRITYMGVEYIKLSLYKEAIGCLSY